jgi:PAS domain S-box-containing protein
MFKTKSRQDQSKKCKKIKSDTEARSVELDASNIMQHGEMEESLNAEFSSMCFAQILDASGNELFMFDADSLKLIDTNRGTRENLGYSLVELADMTPVEFNPDFTEVEFRELLKPLRDGKVRELIYETNQQRKDGSLYPVEARVQFDVVQNRPIYTSLILDITQRRAAEAELSIRDRAIAEANSGIIITDYREQDNPIVYVNPAFVRITGYASNDVIGRNCRFLSAGDSDQGGVEEIRTAIAAGRSCKVEVRNYRKDGGMFWNELTISPVHDREGNITHFVGIQNDITEIKRRKEENEKLALVAEHTNNIVIITEKTGIVEWVNLGFSVVTGFQRSEVLGKKISLLMAGADSAQLNVDKICKCITDGAALNIEHRMLTKSGKEIWVELNIQPVYLETGVKQYVAVGSDISRRKITENALRESQERLSLVMQGANDGIWDWNILTGEVYYSSRFLELLKYKQRNVQRDIKLFSDRLHPSDKKDTWRLIDNHLYKREIFDCEFRMRTDDRGYCWFRARGQASWKADGSPIRMAGSIMDVTSRKQAEAEAKQLRNKLEKRVKERTNELVKARDAANASNHAKSAFLASMSHELRTPMNGVVGMVELLQETFLSQDQTKMVGAIRDSALGLLNILDDILDFSKIEAGKLSIENIPVSLADVIETVSLNLAPNAAMKGLIFELYIDPTLPSNVISDPVRLRQILFNLVGNALKFTKQDSKQQGRVIIRLEREGEEGSHKAQVNFRIIDNGIGMSEEVQSQLFQPFMQADSSTTRQYGGSGLGLSITHRLVGMLGGRIDVKSIENEGTEFTVSLELPISPVDMPDNDLVGITALIVTENPLLREAIHAYLIRAGATVTKLDDIKTAQQCIEREKPQLVILDGTRNQEEKNMLIQSVQKDMQLSSVRFVAISSRLSQDAISNYPGVSWVECNPLLPSDFLQSVKCVLGQSEQVLNHETTSLAADDEPPSNEDAEAEGTLILVAEDNEINQEVIRRQLNLLGYAVDIAGNGYEALEKYKTHRYGLLLTDCFMPEMDGFDLTKSIRQLERDSDKRLPIIAITANVIQREAKACLDSGMDGYLFKPVEMTVLRKTVNKWLPIKTTTEILNSTSTASKINLSTAGTPPADVGVLTKLVGDDPMVHKRLLEGFIMSTRQILDELDTVWEDQSPHVAAGLMHKLKSSARSVGAKKLGDLCEALEKEGKQGNWRRLKENRQRFLDQCDEVIEYLESYLKVKMVG